MTIRKIKINVASQLPRLEQKKEHNHICYYAKEIAKISVGFFSGIGISFTNPYSQMMGFAIGFAHSWTRKPNQDESDKIILTEEVAKKFFAFGVIQVTQAMVPFSPFLQYLNMGLSFHSGTILGYQFYRVINSFKRN